MICKTAFSLLAAVSFAGLSNAATIGQLGVLDSSTGLVAGQQYRLAFVTSTGTPFTSSDIGFYNTFAQTIATNANANYGTVSWKIIGSTQAVDARDNTGTNPNISTGVPIFLMDGITKIADNNADLWDGSLDNALSLDENGAAATGNAGRVLTGSLADGTESDGSQYLGNPTQVRSGGLANTNSLWMRIFTENPNGGLSSQAIYAMSDVLTVVPEPSSLALLGLGGLMIARRRRA